MTPRAASGVLRDDAVARRAGRGAARPFCRGPRLAVVCIQGHLGSQARPAVARGRANVVGPRGAAGGVTRRALRAALGGHVRPAGAGARWRMGAREGLPAARVPAECRLLALGPLRPPPYFPGPHRTAFCPACGPDVFSEL